MEKFNLVWGDSVAVREQFVNGIPTKLFTDFRNELLGMNYPPFEGDAILLDHTREVVKRQIGRTYKHVILTNGAAGGCTITMRAYKLQGRDTALTYRPPYFSLYPAMIEASGLRHQMDFYADPKTSIFLVDSPSNPKGIIRDSPRDFMPIIWDAVYGNNVYTKFNRTIPHDVLVGSYSKLTGLNGIRIGWIATDDSLLFERIKSLVSAEYCGLSVPSVGALNKILPHYDWEYFESNARLAMDFNRTEWQKLEKFFQGETVSENGMFYYGSMDKKCQELFYKAGVIWTPGTSLGHTDDFGRFNIGQSDTIIKNAVAQVLKSDRLP